MESTIASGIGSVRLDLFVVCNDVLTSSTEPPSTVFSKDGQSEANIESLLTELRPNIRKLVVGEIALPMWTPPEDFDPEVVSHLKDLQIPEIKGKPNLLLHDLGSFKTDSVLKRRLDNIFMANNHTFVSSPQISFPTES